MLVLGIDTSGLATAAALWDDSRNEALASALVPMSRGHAEAVMPVVRDVVRDGLGPDPDAIRKVDRIAVVTGPGSFTGVRIGVAAARGLALALGVPAVGITAFAPVAALVVSGGCAGSERGDEPFAVAFDARRDQLYLQCFAADGSPLGAAAALAIEDAAAALPPGVGLAFGSGAALLAEAASRAGRDVEVRSAPAGEAIIVARLGTGVPAGDPAVPLYLRAPDAKPQRPALARVPA